jgi:hypothetical protein
MEIKNPSLFECLNSQVAGPPLRSVLQPQGRENPQQWLFFDIVAEDEAEFCNGSKLVGIRSR